MTAEESQILKDLDEIREKNKNRPNRISAKEIAGRYMNGEFGNGWDDRPWITMSKLGAENGHSLTDMQLACTEIIEETRGSGC